MGEYSIDGVSGTGANTKLAFSVLTGHLLPTGITVDNVAGVQASCIDVLKMWGLMEQSFPMISISCPKASMAGRN